MVKRSIVKITTLPPPPPSPPPPSVALLARYAQSCRNSSRSFPPVAPERASSYSSADEYSAASYVPRMLHQTWKSCEVPPRQREWWDRCARLSGTSWDFNLWTDAANRQFVVQHFPAQLAMYDAYNVHIKRVDAIRYMLLAIYGGVYMDLDFACVKSLESIPLWRSAGEAILIMQRKSHFDHEAASNAFMAAPPRHPFFAFVVGQLAASANHRHVLDATGPRFLTRVWRAWTKGGTRPSGPPSVLAAAAAEAGAGGGVQATGESLNSPSPSSSTATKRSAINYTVSMRFEPWALLHRVHSCRPQGFPGPPCHGPWNYAPCKQGKPAELDKCAITMPNTSVTTFWMATWAADHVKSLKGARASAGNHSSSTTSTANSSISMFTPRGNGYGNRSANALSRANGRYEQSERGYSHHDSHGRASKGARTDEALRKHTNH